MKLGGNQPYFFPYIGYWQLMNAVDLYVIADDFNYIKGGWVNRNKILIGGEGRYLNLPLKKPSSRKWCNETIIDHNEDRIDECLRKVMFSYKNAPYFSVVYPMIEAVMKCDCVTLSDYVKHSFSVLCPYLGIDTKIIMSSSLDKDMTLKKQEKIIDICKVTGADAYYNAIGGREIYSFDDFKSEGITLKFLTTNEITYPQFDNEFVPNLSIIDVMMFNSQEQIHDYLKDYTLVEHEVL